MHSNASDLQPSAKAGNVQGDGKSFHGGRDHSTSITDKHARSTKLKVQGSARKRDLSAGAVFKGRQRASGNRVGELRGISTSGADRGARRRTDRESDEEDPPPDSQDHYQLDRSSIWMHAFPVSCSCRTWWRRNDGQDPAACR